jgi:hypothetical protein
MRRLSVLAWIGNAAAVLCGRRGAVTSQTREVGCSRQAAYEQAGRVEQAVREVHGGGPSRAAFVEQVAALREENRQLWQALEQAVDFPEAKQRHFAGLAAAAGLSLNQVVALLAVLLPAAARPSRAVVGRWVQAAGRQAGRVLAVLDQACAVLVRRLCLDEIFCHGRPVLVGVEPYSLAWLVGQKAADCTGATWRQALAPWPGVESVVADGGSGLRNGLAQVQAERLASGGRTLETGLDLFHIKQEAQRVLRVLWAPVVQAWERAERADAVLAAKRWHGHKGPAQTAAHAANRAWRKAYQRFEAYERQEQAWRRLEAAFELYRPDGRPSDRAAAQADIARALAGLVGPVWDSVRNVVQDPRSLTFLDQLQRGLAAAEPRADVRAALVELWRVRHPSRRGRGPQVPEPVRRLRAVVQALVCRALATDWQSAYRKVAEVLSRVVRASSAVEGMNSVVRMHQARHRQLTQGLLDLKRLYWNCRRFVAGKRRRTSPYQLLGLSLPTADWWQLLGMDADALRQQLSPAQVTV